jgi:hypothetical protein
MLLVGLATGFGCGRIGYDSVGQPDTGTTQPDANNPDANTSPGDPCVPSIAVAACDADGDGFGGDVDPDNNNPCTPSFAALACDWYDPAYGGRVRLTIDNAARNEDLVDFPVLVVLDSVRFPYDSAASDGSDLRFVDANKTLLAHEIETWNPTGVSTIWVRVPLIRANEGNGFINLYYDNGTPEPALPTTEVWSDSYILVLHLAGDALDSSVFANHGSLSGPVPIATPTGIGLAFSAASQDHGTVLASASLNAVGNPFTVSAYARHRASQPAYRAIISRRIGTTDLNDIWLGYFDDKYHAGLSTSNGGGALISSSPRPEDTWQHLELVWNGSTFSYYVDGSLAVSNSVSGDFNTSGPPWQIGADTNNGTFPDADFLEGDIDEIRISTQAHSPAWVGATSDAFQDRLLTYGPPESRP